jgi:cytoskeletal protein CcmA (bactofilin family)
MHSLTHKAESASDAFDGLSSDALALDLESNFGSWLRAVENIRDDIETNSGRVQNIPSWQFNLESLGSSNCEINFEGVLEFSGHFTGNISSLDGTLLIAENAEINGQIEVGMAVIEGTVNGDIAARDSIKLDSHAKIRGKINSPSLSITYGAIFEGGCVFIEGEEVKSLVEKYEKADAEEHRATKAHACSSEQKHFWSKSKKFGQDSRYIFVTG